MSHHVCKCKREFDNPQSFNSHKRWCLIHRDGKLPLPAGKTAWNKGKTKHSDERLANAGKKISAVMIGKPGHKLTVEQKLTLSSIMSERLLKGYADGTRVQAGGNCEWYEVDGVKAQGTWERRTAQILSQWKKSGKIVDCMRCPHRFRYEVDGKHRTYHPDFFVTTSNSEYILEVKGRKSLVDDLKWASARQYFELVVWSLEDILNNELELTHKA